MAAQYLPVLLIFGATAVFYADGARILVNPFNMGHNSRLRNMIKMAELLQEEGHEVSLMSNSMVSNLEAHAKTPKVHRILHFDNDVSIVFDVMSDELKEKMANLANPLNFLDYLRWCGPGVFTICDTMLSNKEFMATLKESNFDLMIFDVAELCGTVIKDYLDVPAIMWSNYGPAFYRTAFYPENPSFMCPSDGFSCNSDTMNFYDRFHNFLHMMIRNNVAMPEFMDGYNQLKQKYNVNVTTDVESVYQRSIVMAMMDFSIEFPRPLPANVIPIPYLFKREPQPLSGEISEFLDNNPNKGIIYLGFGTFVNIFPDDKAHIIASAFSRFEDHVFIWRNNGTAPDNLHSNTLMLDWAPQLDILAHPRAKIFITHCGISSMYETIISGVPFIASPLFWDQNRNAVKIMERAESGIHLDYYNMTDDTLYATIKEMLDNYDYYKSKATRAAQLANSHAVAPKDQFLWWVDYAIRTNGAKHLMTDIVPKLNYIQYLLLDVAVVLVLIVVTIIIVTICLLKRLVKATSK